MKTKKRSISIIILMWLVFACAVSFGQQAAKPYYALIGQADSLYQAKDYQRSGQAYRMAFLYYPEKMNGTDTYNAACSLARAGSKGMALSLLDKAVNVYDYADRSIARDSDLVSLHTDKKWPIILNAVNKNYETDQKLFIPDLHNRLDSIRIYDQFYRNQVDSVQKKFGTKSPEFKALIKKMSGQDSVNLKQVTMMIDRHGWLGPKEVGGVQSNTLFLVIQHADLETQKKYLPVLAAAVKAGKARPGNLAFLTDRILLREGKKQWYASHVGSFDATGELFVMPLEDPDHVDERRYELGIKESTANELKKSWGITWDLAAYKKKLPEIEAFVKKKQAETRPVK